MALHTSLDKLNELHSYFYLCFSIMRTKFRQKTFCFKIKAYFNILKQSYLHHGAKTFLKMHSNLYIEIYYYLKFYRQKNLKVSHAIYKYTGSLLILLFSLLSKWDLTSENILPHILSCKDWIEILYCIVSVSPLVEKHISCECAC